MMGGNPIVIGIRKYWIRIAGSLIGPKKLINDLEPPLILLRRCGAMRNAFILLSRKHAVSFHISSY